MSKSIIVGRGQIGTALGNVLADYKPIFVDIDTDLHITAGEFKGEVEVMHICFGYSEQFVESVKNYQKIFKPKYTVIHSTVPPGTCKQLNAVHSPCIGIHPNLEPGIRTFIKYLGGEQASEVADYFRRAGLKVYIVESSTSTELMKILDTTFYGVCVEYTKDVKRQCDKYKVPFELWTIWTNNYNEGYQKLGHPEFTRPNLVPIMKKIGGHCVRENSELISTPFTEIIKTLNEEQKTN